MPIQIELIKLSVCEIRSFISEIISFSHQVIIYWGGTDIKPESSEIRKEMTAEGFVGWFLTLQKTSDIGGQERFVRKADKN